jgi:hypothetical protein
MPPAFDPSTSVNRKVTVPDGNSTMEPLPGSRLGDTRTPSRPGPVNQRRAAQNNGALGAFS